MAGVQILHQLLRGVYLIDERALSIYGPRVWSLMGVSAGMLSDDKPEMPSVEYLRVENGQIVKSQKMDGSGLIAKIPVSGALMKASDKECGILGTSEMRQMVLDANANPNIRAIILDIDSPGGAVDGTGELADAVRDANKPVYAFANGLVASAGFWIASAAQGGIYASHATAEIGSIGTAISFYDFTQYYEKAGIKQHYINADGSPDKNQDYYKALAGDYQPIIKQLLNPTNALFHKAVKYNREGMLKMNGAEPLTGKVYLAAQAQELGLIDGIMTWEQLVMKAAGMDGTNANDRINLNTTTNMKIKLMGAWTALLSFFGLAAANATDTVEHDVTNADWGALNNQLAERNQLSTDLQASQARVSELEGQLQTAQADLAAEQEAHNALKSKIPAAAAKKPQAPDNDLDNGAEAQLDDLTKKAIELRKNAGLSK